MILHDRLLLRDLEESEELLEFADGEVRGVETIDPKILDRLTRICVDGVDEVEVDSVIEEHGIRVGIVRALRWVHFEFSAGRNHVGDSILWSRRRLESAGRASEEATLALTDRDIVIERAVFVPVRVLDRIRHHDGELLANEIDELGFWTETSVRGRLDQNEGRQSGHAEKFHRTP